MSWHVSFCYIKTNEQYSEQSTKCVHIMSSEREDGKHEPWGTYLNKNWLEILRASAHASNNVDRMRGKPV